MNKEYIEQAIYERTQEFVPQCVYEAILELIATEREACANAMAQIVMTPTLTHGALVKLSDVVNAIRARGNVATNDTSQERVDETAKLRHDVLEEVAKEFDKMPFGDTAASFAQFVRNMKR